MVEERLRAMISNGQLARRRAGWHVEPDAITGVPGTMPGALRARGITPREYEVLALLVLRLRNKEIAVRLHISPRTVEKHVASLLSRTGQADRASLIDYATPSFRAELPIRLLTGHGPGPLSKYLSP
jgi:DNA-binding NarL/FixJ family response regulator